MKSYDHEPKRPANFETEIDKKKSKTEDKVSQKSRVGKIDLCQCKSCRPMRTITESICCRDKQRSTSIIFRKL